MIKLHPEVLKKNGVNEFVILPYDEFVALQKLLADAQDLTDLREAVRVEGGAPTISLEELKTELGCKRQGAPVGQMLIVNRLPRRPPHRTAANSRAPPILHSAFALRRPSALRYPVFICRPVPVKMIVQLNWQDTGWPLRKPGINAASRIGPTACAPNPIPAGCS